MTLERRRPALFAKIKENLETIRTKLLLKPGDELEIVLVAVEALAMSMVDLATDADDLIRNSRGHAAALLTATLTRAMMVRLALLPAAIGALVAVALLIGEEHILAKRYDKQTNVLDQHYENEYADLTQRYDDLIRREKNYFDERKAQTNQRQAELDAAFGAKLEERAAHSETDIRDFLNVEGAQPGFLAWIKRHGLAARRLFEANGNSVCPQVFLDDGTHKSCLFEQP